MQWRAAHALRALEWRPKTDAEEIQLLVALGELDRTLAFGSAAVNAVASVLKHGSYEKRVAAVNVLGEINDPAVMKHIGRKTGNRMSLRRDEQYIPATVMLRDTSMNFRV